MAEQAGQGGSLADASLLLPGERLDDLQTAGLRLIQRPGSFCLSTDSVLLADFASPKRGERIVDLGCGNGAIALLLAGHCAECEIDAVEIDAEPADMARRSVRLNGLESRVRVHQIDMRDAWRTLGHERFSLAVCNPPYGADWPRRTGETTACARAGLEPEDVTASAAKLLRYRGRLCVCYPAVRAFGMMSAMQSQNLSPKRVRCVQSRPDSAPRLMLIEAIKGGHPGLEWLAPLCLYDADGGHSAEWSRIYGEG